VRLLEQPPLVGMARLSDGRSGGQRGADPRVLLPCMRWARVRRSL